MLTLPLLFTPFYVFFRTHRATSWHWVTQENSAIT